MLAASFVVLCWQDRIMFSFQRLSIVRMALRPSRLLTFASRPVLSTVQQRMEFSPKMLPVPAVVHVNTDELKFNVPLLVTAGVAVTLAVLADRALPSDCMLHEDAQSDDDHPIGKAPNIDNWNRFGCLSTCRGREEKVPKSSADGSGPDPHIGFECPGCRLLFHADCVGLKHSEKRRIARSEETYKAACPQCVLTISDLWRAATGDTANVMSAFFQAINIPAGQKKPKDLLKEICQTCEPVEAPPQEMADLLLTLERSMQDCTW